MNGKPRFRSTVVAAIFALLVVRAQAVTFDWVTVGNQGNAPDHLYPDPDNPTNLRFGSVADAYDISQFETTNAQYIDFLNAADAGGTNPNHVYNSIMGSSNRGGIEFDAGAPSGSKYSPKPNMDNKPVNWVSFFDAMRFVNWLENGQPTDGSGTEGGVYSISDGVNETRAPGATYFIPSEDEWYKAAYFDPRSFAQGGPPGDDNYWLYPTKSDVPPIVATANSVGDIINPGPNVANYNQGVNWNGTTWGNVSTVGTAGSTSYFGTFDQGGNNWEWNEGTGFGCCRSYRGGSHRMFQGGLEASAREGYFPTLEDHNYGFRVARLPELLLGDMNLSGLVDFDDIAPFVLGLGDVTAYEEQHGQLPVVNGDTDGNGIFDFDDIAGFVDILAGGGTVGVVIPEPSSLALVGIGMAALALAWRRVT